MNKIVELSQINKLNTRNIIKIQCENDRHLFTSYSKKRCKNCGSFICKKCAKNDFTKCIMCQQNNKHCLNNCPNIFRKLICHLCGNIIIMCSCTFKNNSILMLGKKCYNNYFDRCKYCKDKICYVCNKN